MNSKKNERERIEDEPYWGGPHGTVIVTGQGKQGKHCE